MNHLILCKCGEVIVKSFNSDTKVRAKVIVFRNSTAYAVCKSCSAEVHIPLRLDVDMLKSMTAETQPVRLYIRDVKNS